VIGAALAAGVVIGLALGALGGGGSLLTVPALVYLVGQEPRAATTSSLVIVGVSALIGAVGHARSGRVRWRLGAAFGVSGVAAGFLGSQANRLVNQDVLLLTFAVLIVVAAAGMLAKARSPARQEQARTAVLVGAASYTLAPEPSSPVGPPGRGRTARIIGAGLVVGFLTGFFGVGGGFVIVPALAVALALPMSEAVATSLLVIAINAAVALAARAGTASFDWAVIVPFTLAAVTGSLLGKGVADRLSGPAMTRAFAMLMLAVALYTGIQSVVSLAG
jgi:uncharacterized membrane protein YfcA